MDIFILTNKETSRCDDLYRQLCNEGFKANDIKLVKKPLFVSPVELARRGIVDLYPSHAIPDKLYSWQDRVYRPGTLGCQLNHFIATNQFVDTGSEYALILEDNAELTPGFKSAIQSVLENMAMTHWDIIHLYSCLDHERINYTGNIYRGKDEWGTSKAQLISRKYALEMLKRIPFHEVSDGYTMLPSLSWARTDLASFITLPHLAFKSTQHQSIRVATDIKSPEFRVALIPSKDPRLMHIEDLSNIDRCDLLANLPEQDLYLGREAYLVRDHGNNKCTLHRLDARLAISLSPGLREWCPSHAELVEKSDTNSITEASDGHRKIAFNAKYAREVFINGVMNILAITPKDLRFHTSLLNSHCLSAPARHLMLDFFL